MEHINLFEYLIYAVAVFITAVISGISGAGGGFVMTPLLIFFGLSPAQAVSTGKISGLAVSLGSLSGLKSIKVKSKRLFAVVLVLAFVIGLLSPLIITKLDSDFYRLFLGLLLIGMVPILHIKKIGHTSRKTTRPRKIAGLGFLSLSLGLQGVFSGGLGTLVNLSLINFMGLSAVEANVLKRYSQVVLNTMVILGVMFSGLIVWQIAVLGVIFSGAGGYIGGRIAVSKGNKFIMDVMLILMLLSGLWLIFG